jgi:hypothetical protein
MVRNTPGHRLGRRLIDAAPVLLAPWLSEEAYRRLRLELSLAVENRVFRAGVAEALRVHALRGRLSGIRIGRDHLTTRRWLHEHLMSEDDSRGHTKPLPLDYQAPE